MVNADIYQLKVTLRNVRPEVWRRVLVPGDFRLSDLHEVLQCAMGWTDSHLHAFRIGDVEYGPSGRDVDDVLPEDRVTLGGLVGPRQQFTYQYDFGDSWDHEIRVEKVFAPEAGERAPACSAGARACPPEDCGGAWGYADLLSALADRKHPEHAEKKDWMGGPFDPEAFDLAGVNRQLAGLARPRRARAR